MSQGKYHYLRPGIIEALGSDKPFENAEMAPTRQAYAEALLELGETNPKVVVCDADVSKSIRTIDFKAKYPDRSFNFGIAEQNMIAAAAGMSTTGLIPFATTYAMFACMRGLDQIRNSIHYPKNNVKIGAGHSGITPGPDGVTHQAQEDLSVMRTLANSCIIAPADCVSGKMATLAAAEYVGPVYISMTRDPVPTLFTDDYPFEIGKPVLLREGSDVTIFGMRDLTAHALVAAEALEKEGISARVIDVHTLKPLDEEMVLAACAETGCAVTAENNVKYGGLGSAVAELLVANNPMPMEQIGVNDTFCESGPYLDLLERYGMSSAHIIDAARRAVSRKK